MGEMDEEMEKEIKNKNKNKINSKDIIIVIDPEFRDIIRPLSPEEREGLEESLIAEGCRDALIIARWPDNKGAACQALADGHHRYEICREHNLSYKTTIVDFPSRDDVKLWICDNQLGRRNLETFNRAELAHIKKPIIEKKAKENQGRRTDIRANLPECFTPIITREEVAKEAGVSGRTVSMVEKILEKAPPEVLDKLRNGDPGISINKVYNDIRREEKREANARATPKMPEMPEMFGPAQEPVNVPRLFVGSADNLSFLEDESVDLIITSPPYNLGGGYWPMGGDGATPRENGIGYTGYSDDMPEQEYQAWQLRCLNEFYRVAKQGASLFYNHKVRQVDCAIIHPMDWLRGDSNPWIIRQEIIWDRGSTHNHCPTLFWPQDERIYWLTKGDPQMPERSIGMASIWRFNGPTHDMWHPAPFPEKLPETCIKALGRPGIVVLDPFGGGMTTCKVAQQYGYDSVGVDISQEYVDRARRENAWTNI